jgi:hypothetical protein
MERRLTLRVAGGSAKPSHPPWSFSLHPAWLVAPLLLSGLSSCRSERAEPARAVHERGRWPVPASDDGSAFCADVRDVRVCWEKGAARVRPAELPFPGATVERFRCSGGGATRTCVERRRDAPPFRCAGDRCEQPHPRLPDHGEWECADLAGVVSCRGGEPAAGIAPAGPDPSFVCGARRAADGGTNERVCLDYSPDLPDEPGAYRCHFESKPGPVRVCLRGNDVHQSGDACDRARPCVSGLTCAGGRCVPPAPPPVCWLDADCPTGVPCRFGACVEGAP